MSLDFADILREHWPDYVRAHYKRLCKAHYRAVRSVLTCRTPAMGGRLYRCQNAACRKPHFAYHSCNHRNCPRCGARDQQLWTAKQEASLLPASYFLITFTIPSELRSLCLQHPKELYDCLLKESAGALTDVVASKLKSPSARIGLTSVLHTWGRQMQHHPHVHVIMPAVAFDEKANKLIYPKNKDRFLVHHHPLADRFRNRIRTALQEQYPDIYQNLSPDQIKALSPATRWNVQLQPAGQGKTAIRYLARYVQRSALGPKRIADRDQEGRYLVHWKESESNKPGILRLAPFELIRRFLLHVLPKGFARIRHYGFHSSAAKKTRLRVRALMGELGEPTPVIPELPPFTCEHCGGELLFLRELKRIRPLRGPPLIGPPNK